MKQQEILYSVLRTERQSKKLIKYSQNEVRTKVEGEIIANVREATDAARSVSCALKSEAESSPSSFKGNHQRVSLRERYFVP